MIEWSLCSAAASTPDLLNGAWRAKGSKVAVGFILENPDSYFPDVSDERAAEIKRFAQVYYDEWEAAHPLVAPVYVGKFDTSRHGRIPDSK